MYVMTLEPSVQAAIVTGVVGTIAAVCGIVVAFVNNRKERGDAAENAMVTTLRERIILRDEQLAIKDHIIEELREELELYKDGRLS